MEKCLRYPTNKIIEGYPLEMCKGCENNIQDAEDGLYTCRLLLEGLGGKKEEEHEIC